MRTFFSKIRNYASRHRLRLALLGVAAAAFMVIAAGLVLKFRYCLPCSDPERVERGAALLCCDSDSAKRRGLSMLERAAGNGLPQALALLGELYLEPPEGYVLGRPETRACLGGPLPGNGDRSLAGFRRLAGVGDLDGRTLYNLGVLLEKGLLREDELDGSAEDYFQRSAEAGSPFGMFAVGRVYHLQGDYAEAAHWFGVAFEKGGHPEAAIMLGDYHLHGRGMKRDRDQAMAWYRKALRSAKESAAKGLVGNLELVAGKRLNLAAAGQQGLVETRPIRVEYRLQGSLDEYLVFLRDGEQPIGRVVRRGDSILASYAGPPQAGEQQVASMVQGLDWVLQSYAVGRYGGEQKFRFLLVGE
ncbi:hypothetical protein DESUT3_05450 [Desulfuromonas versatilis]|uniref:Sel1 repeat family protein n=1 Tax=Desulfuromonas versatilis TaxID=2802975 RepID=A0ABN6DWD3_9BACT|nr:tetratricopeptide repeat protein [Desulfuromonas versatilis]BCR03476.1 hypothetical protein DESUT3_05450 [Desulfuromonas versatilis]